MSITGAKNFFEKSGCGAITMVLVAGVMILGIVGQCGAGGQSPLSGLFPGSANASGTVGAKLGGQVITQEMLANLSSQKQKELEDQYRNGTPPEIMWESLQPSQIMEVRYNILGELVRGMASIKIAEDNGIKLDKEAAKAKLVAGFNQQLEQFKQQLISEGKLQATATQEQFDAELKKVANGKTAKMLLDDASTKFDTDWESPGGKLAYGGQAAQQSVVEKFTGTSNPTKEQVADIFRLMRLRSVVFPRRFDNDRIAEAKKVMEDIKSGKITFEDAQDKYSQNKFAPKDKKPREYIDGLSMQFLQVDDTYAVLKNLKPGEIMLLEGAVDGPVIYKMLRIEDNKPKDFDTNYAQYAMSHSQFLAQSKFNKLQKEEIKKIEWVDKGLEQLYKVAELYGNPTYTREFDAVMNAAAALPDNPNAQLAKFLAMRRIWRMEEPRRAELADSYLKSLDQMNATYNSPLILLDSADVQADIKKSPEAGKILAAVARGLTMPGSTGITVKSGIETRLNKWKGTPVVSAEDEAEIKKEFARWQTMRDARRKELGFKSDAEMSKTPSPVVPEKK